MRRHGSTIFAFLVSGLLGAVVPDASRAQQPTPTATVAERVRTLLIQAVPTWDASVLRVGSRTDWSRGLSFSSVLTAMRDVKALPQNLPSNAQQVRLGESSVRLKRSLGRVRYVNADRAWNHDSNARTQPVDSARAVGVVAAALREIRLPQDELGAPVVVTQMGVGGPTTSSVPTDTIEMYRIVSIRRFVNKLPVEESRALAAINYRGAIQRLSTDWPQFRMRPDLALRSRNDVISEALRQIMEQVPDGRVTLQARLVYTPQGLDDVWYVPAVSIAVTTTETPFIVLMPVANRPKS